MGGDWISMSIAVYLTCYDYRLGEVPAPKSTVYYNIARFVRRGFALHLKWLKPLDIRMLVGFKRDKELARKLISVETDTDKLRELGVPSPRLLHGIIVHTGGRVYFVYYLPRGLWPEDTSFFEEWWEAWQVPAMNCLGKRTTDVGDMESLEANLKILLNEPKVRVRSPGLVYLLLAVLDANPLVTLRALSKVAEAVEARGLGEYEAALNMKYLTKYYRKLSRAKVLGRVYVLEQPKESYKLTVVAPRSCARKLYGFVSATLTAPFLYVPAENRGHVMAALVLAPREAEEMLRLLYTVCPEAEVYPRLRGMASVFPYELFDPLENRWKPEPTEGFLRILERMRLLVKQHQREQLLGGQA